MPERSIDEGEQQRGDTRDQGGVRRDARPLLLRGRRGRLGRALDRVHEDYRVHEGEAGIAAALPAFEAVALISGHQGSAGGALVTALDRRGLDRGRGKLGPVRYGSDPRQGKADLGLGCRGSGDVSQLGWIVPRPQL